MVWEAWISPAYLLHVSEIRSLWSYIPALDWYIHLDLLLGELFLACSEVRYRSTSKSSGSE